MRTLTNKSFGFDLMLPSSISPAKTIDEYRAGLPAKQVEAVSMVLYDYQNYRGLILDNRTK